jgi:nitrogenase molybdenum-iron protein beta chain
MRYRKKKPLQKGTTMPVSLANNEPLPIIKDVVEKTNSLEQVRYICSMGSLASVLAIPRATPITHCGPGCANKQMGSVAGFNGYQNGEYFIPSTNATEQEVVFGGAVRLNELIEATIKLMDSDLFVVLTGCISDLVGDDVGSVVRKYQKQGVPIVYAETGGFRGNNFTGHELITRAIIDQFVGDYDGPRETGSVNIWSLLPFQNPFWRGDFTEIKRVLEGIGLKVNILFGQESAGVSEWKNLPKAQFNLVLSPWLGLATARHLEKKYGQPFLHVPVIPIGADQTSAFLRQVTTFAGLDEARTEAFIAAEEKHYFNYLRDFAGFYTGYTCQYHLPSLSVVLSESAYNLAITKFIVNQLGLTPGRQIITENPPDEFRDAIRAEFRNIAEDVTAEVEFEEDGYFIHKRVQETDFSNHTPVVFGTTWEGELAKNVKGVLVEVGYPSTDEVVLSRSYIGYRGALTLLEKIYTTVVRASTAA